MFVIIKIISTIFVTHLDGLTASVPGSILFIEKTRNDAERRGGNVYGGSKLEISLRMCFVL